jgi:predicted lactoylglutathione lyase
MINSEFINLPVDSLSQSMEFFTELGFAFNSQFTDAEAAE